MRVGMRWEVVRLAGGRRAVEAHRAVGRDIAKAGTWEGVAVVGGGAELGPLADASAEGLREGGVSASRLLRAESPEEAGYWLESRMAAGVAVLLKGSRGATMEKVLDWLGRGDA